MDGPLRRLRERAVAACAADMLVPVVSASFAGVERACFVLDAMRRDLTTRLVSEAVRVNSDPDLAALHVLAGTAAVVVWLTMKTDRFWTCD
jgi:hypothetical protein